MIWCADTQTVLVFKYAPNFVLYYPISSYIQLLDNPVTDTPPYLGIRPINAFGRVWGNYADVRAALGWASSIELSYTLQLTEVGSSMCLNRPTGGVVIWSSNGYWTNSGADSCTT